MSQADDICSQIRTYEEIWVKYTEKLMQERDELKDMLREILAAIHGDGGHHTEKVGFEDSLKDALEAICKKRRADEI